MEIKRLIDHCARTVDERTSQTRDAGSVMEEVPQAIRRLAALNDEIAAALHEQG